MPLLNTFLNGWRWGWAWAASSPLPIDRLSEMTVLMLALCHAAFLYSPLFSSICFLSYLFDFFSDHFSLTGPICCFYSSAASWKYSVLEYTTLYLCCDELIAVSSSECDGASCLESLNRHSKALLPEEHQRTMRLYIHENYSLSSVLCSWHVRWQ